MPDAYRQFLTHIGGSGAAPFYVLMPLERCSLLVMNPREEPGTPCGFDDAEPGGHGRDIFLQVIEMGCTDVCVIAVTGPLTGRVLIGNSDGFWGPNVSSGTGKGSIAGFEYAGEIAVVGQDAGDWGVGDLVVGTFPSAFVEYLVADHRFVLPRPRALAPEVACVLPAALLTEFGALTIAGFRLGQSVLSTGASTGIGMIGIQIARTFGASRVIATTRSAGEKDLFTGLGADTVIITGNGDDLARTVRAATGGKGVDVVLDHVAGGTFAVCLPATAHDGQVVNIGRLAGPATTIDLDALSYRHLTVQGVSFGFSRDWETVPILDGLLAEVLPAVGRGGITPVIDTTLTIGQYREAADRLRSGNTVGKTVLTFV